MTTQAQRSGDQPAGLTLAGWLTLLLIGLCACLYLVGDGTLSVIRLIDLTMIRIGVALFALAFAAVPLAALYPGRISGWLKTNRHNLLLGFGVALTPHLAAIGRLYVLDEALFWSASPFPLIVLRGIAIGLILVVLAQALRPRDTGVVPRLAVFGEYYVWGAFMSGFAKRIPQDPLYILPVALLLVVLAVRLVALTRRTQDAP